MLAIEVVDNFDIVKRWAKKYNGHMFNNILIFIKD
jgi:hypothetical protein